MTRPIEFLPSDERGTVSVEYALLALILAVGLIATLLTFPASLNAIWSTVATNLN
jgi:Flp pilus assembly pilin Flp